MLSGALGVFTGDEEDGERLVTVLPAGEVVGEMALISGRPRSASIVALRDSELVRLPSEAYDDLVERQPQKVLQLTRALVRRLERSISAGPSGLPARTLALIPLSPGVPVEGVARGLQAALRAQGFSTAIFDSALAGHGSAWFHRAEAERQLVLYQGTPQRDGTTDGWTLRCLRQSDRVVLLADGTAAPPAAPPKLAAADLARSDLVLLQPAEAARPGPAAPWLRVLPGLALHLHLRAGRTADLARLARRVTGTAPGLVLAGGGARGFAHLGAIRALREAGVPIDRVGGTSMGAIIAAGLACGWDEAEHLARTRAAFVDSKPLSDVTLPLISLFRGRKVVELLQTHFGDLAIEDTWLPFYSVSTNLTASRMVVERRGPLWRALRASISIPGVLPPVVADGEILVDGAVINHFPADVMASIGRGPVIGVDIAGGRALAAEVESLDAGVLRNLFRLRRGQAPGIVSILTRAGTVSSTAQAKALRRQLALFLEPPLESIDLLDWKSFERGVEIGYRHTAEVLERIDVGALLQAGQVDDAGTT